MRLKKIVIGLITGFVNGLFGSGGGTIAVPSFQKFLGLSPHKSHGTVITLILPLSMLSAFIYCRTVEIQWINLGLVSVGGVVGGYLGASFLKKISNKWLHRLFGLFMIIAAARLIL